MLRSACRHALRFIVWVSLTGSPSRVPVRKTQTTNQEYRQSFHKELQAAALAQHQVLRSTKTEKRLVPKWLRILLLVIAKRSEKILKNKNKIYKISPVDQF